jgi:hypothetical protein
VKLQVRIWEYDNQEGAGEIRERGTITWDGKKMEATDAVKNLICPIGRNVHGNWVIFDPVTNPVEWLDWLQYHYKSEDLMADAPEIVQ